MPKIFPKITAVLTALLLASSARAVVAPPEPVELHFADGTAIPATRYASENAAFAVDERGRLWRQQGSSLRRVDVRQFDALRRAAGHFARPLRGATGLLALRVAFSDVAGSVPRAEHAAVLFGKAHSLRDYYDSVSDGTLAVSGDVLPSDGSWLQLDEPLAAYGADLGPGNADPTRHDHGEKSPEALVEAVVRLADPTVDFSQFDWDGDGAVDHLLIIHAGDDQAASRRSDDIWSRQVVLPGPLEADGVRIESAMIVAETSPLGTFCHEFAHDLGAPDLYGLDDVGPWGLMGTGCWNGDPPGSCPARLSAPLLWDMDGDPRNGRQGWVMPSVARPGASVDLTAGPVLLPISQGETTVLAEWRDRQGYDAELPGHGVLLYVLSSTRPAVKILTPGRGERNATALHPGDTVSLPDGAASVTVTGEGLVLLQETALAENAQAAVPERVSLSVFPNPFRSATSLAVRTGAASAVISIFDALGRQVARFADVTPGTSVRWNGRDAAGRVLPAGVYLVRLKDGRSVATARVLLLR